MTPPLAGKSSSKPSRKKKRPIHPLRAAVLRGLAVVLPPLMTVVIFLWIGATVGDYIVKPLVSATQTAIVWGIADIRPENEIPQTERGEPIVVIEGTRYVQLLDLNYVPEQVYDSVQTDGSADPVPVTGLAVYNRFVKVQYLNSWGVVVFFVSLFILVLYLLGKFMAAGVGRFFWSLFERGVAQVPLVRNVYNAVKQVSDFILAQREVEFSRVVAVEWPRRGMWVLAFVTGESIPDIEAAANEPVLSILVPTSPMPVTGFTITVKKSETIDLNISFDQAFQFIVSCGVAVPPDVLDDMTIEEKEQFYGVEQPVEIGEES